MGFFSKLFKSGANATGLSKTSGLNTFLSQLDHLPSPISRQALKTARKSFVLPRAIVPTALWLLPSIRAKISQCWLTDASLATA